MSSNTTTRTGKVLFQKAFRNISSTSPHAAAGYHKTCCARTGNGTKSMASSGIPQQPPSPPQQQQQQQQRCFNTDKEDANSFSSYIYPLRTEAPVVTRTTASTAAISSKEGKKRMRVGSDGSNSDRFDDNESLSAEERDRLLQEQKKNDIQLKGSAPIGKTPPKHIPSNVPSKELVAPKTEITTLENGIRVVSQETYGQVSTIGLVADVGSRHEQKHQLGVAHLLDFLAFSGSTREDATTNKYDSALSITQLLQDWGGSRFVNYGREQTIHCIDILRPNVTKAMDLLSATYIHPKFDSFNIEDGKRTIEFQALDMPPELLLEEAIQRAAYGTDSQLGKPHFCPLESLPHLNLDVVNEFWFQHIVNNPKGLVIAGAGIGHEELVDLSNHYFGTLQQSSPITDDTLRTVPSQYSGGDHFVDLSPPAGVEEPMHFSPDRGLIRVAVAFELQQGWHSDDLVTACVLQTLLGGGNSFSAGGPGKGMYSRLYRQVLNRYSWVESCEAFTSIHNESGLWGISGSCYDHKSVQDLTSILCENLYKLANEYVTDEEIDRARNMLKCNVLTQLESRLVLFEDLGRQVLTYGHREDMNTTCAKIDAVTKENILKLVSQTLLNKAPTIAAVGEKLDYVPRQKEITKWFGS